MSAELHTFLPLSPEQLTPAIDPERLGFETTAELEGEPSPLGSGRALAALRLGVRLRTPGYNVLVAGLEGQGREQRVRDLVSGEAVRLPAPPDILYVNNFADPDRPLVLTVPAGEGRRLRQEMDELVAVLRRRIPEALKKEGFEREKEQITVAYDRQVKELFHRFPEAAREQGGVLCAHDLHLFYLPLLENILPEGEKLIPRGEFPRWQRLL